MADSFTSDTERKLQKNEKEKMNSYITNLSNNQSDMEGHTLAREFYLKQKKKMEKTQ